MTGPQCSEARCSVPAGNMCLRRLEDFHECPAFTKGVKQTASPELGAIHSDDIQVPWTGYSMTLPDMSMVWSVKRAPLIALIGLSKSGKSSFLSTLYLRLKTEPVGQRQFAGSLTLRGWASISEKMYWTEELEPGFPPRTSGEARESGFLHLTLADGASFDDVLIADVPGEWFAQLLENLYADSAASARLIIQQADAALFFLDTAALSEPNTRFAVERSTKVLLDRIVKLRPGLPLIAVHAKHDKASGGTQRSFELLQAHIEKAFGNTQTFETVAASINPATDATEALTPGQGVTEAFAAVLQMAATSRPAAEKLTRTQNSAMLATLQELN
jgi:Double-GTPase 2